MKNEDYVKVVYESKPIGEEKIILYLTTFDVEAFERAEKLKEIPKKIIAKDISIDRYQINNSDFIYKLDEILNDIVEQNYKIQIERLKDECEKLKAIRIVSNDKNAKNITNSGDVHCNIVYGNINNCDNIYCHEIKGNVVNCDKIIYK